MFYFNLGIRHITDLEGYDHMLFLLALTLPLSFVQWKATLKWITAFTIGHSLSLAITALKWVKLPNNWVEFGIALTIAMTVLYHLINGFRVSQGAMWMAGIFGLIHGLGFGSYYTFITQSDSFWWAWIPFNLGIEAGQILVVLALLFVYWTVEKIWRNPKAMKWMLSGVIITLSVQMILDRLPPNT
jgi:hydrogenase/urease accessory protein HupE